jgi:hypothetical protein
MNWPKAAKPGFLESMAWYVYFLQTRCAMPKITGPFHFYKRQDTKKYCLILYPASGLPRKYAGNGSGTRLSRNRPSPGSPGGTRLFPDMKIFFIMLR